VGVSFLTMEMPYPKNFNDRYIDTRKDKRWAESRWENHATGRVNATGDFPLLREMALMLCRFYFTFCTL